MNYKIILHKIGDHPSRRRVTVVPTLKDIHEEVKSILKEYNMPQIVAWHTDGTGHYATLSRILRSGKQENYRLSMNPTEERLRNFGGGIDVAF